MNIPKDASPVERWWWTVHYQTMDFLPLESALSFPVPMIKGDVLMLEAFHYGVKPGGDPGKAIAMPPTARLIATFPQGRLLFFLHRTIAELFAGLPSSGELGPLSSVWLSAQERKSEKKALFALYTPILAQYRGGSKDGTAARDFLAAFERIAGASLLPYYRALNPHFFAWLAE